MSKTILITGGAGFIGSNFVKYILRKYTDYKVVNFDALTYAGNLENLKDIESNVFYSFVKGDVADRGSLKAVFKTSPVDFVVNFAAESHVDRSIEDSEVFIKTNVLGTQILLDLSKQYNVKKYVQVSTDEVYGTLGETGFFTEKTPLAPNNPYAASKAAADLLVSAYYTTFKVPVNITRCSNNYGPYQFPEKLIPLMIANAYENKPLPVYGDGLNIRDWLYVEDHCSAIDAVLHNGNNGEIYNIGGNNESTNISIVKTILNVLGKDESLIHYVDDRLGHDRRYAIDAGKIRRELGWVPLYTFDCAIKDTIKWYMQNIDWWTKIRNGAYLIEHPI